MKRLIYIILVAIGFASCSGKITVISEDNLPEDLFYLDNEIKPYSGKAIIYFCGTTTIKEELTYNEGILNGLSVSYYKSGAIRRKGEYFNGMFTGKWEAWHENGNKQYEIDYTNDTLCGKYISWYPNGVIEEKGTYSKNIRSGEWIKYDKAGMIINERNYN